MAKEARMAYRCQQCGWQSPKWFGRCPECGQYGSLAQVSLAPTPSAPRGQGPVELAKVGREESQRLLLGFPELNRVLGGGVVPGSLILIGGDPGVGKSTLLLQALSSLAEKGGKVFYASGEESASQVKLRAERLGVEEKNLFLMAETDLEAVIQGMESLSPHLAVVDSIQAVHLEGLGGAGSLAQVRECTLRLMAWAKGRNVPLFITGHVTKEGALAGPRTLEHIVDVVLYLEGESASGYRLLRSVKNRFGSTQEVAVFEMGEKGLREVEDPSSAFLAERLPGAVGSVVVPVIEGSRPFLVEVQALTSPTPFSLPRRSGNGVDFNRLLLVAAVLSRHLHLPLAGQDILVNAVGGLQVREPAADLGMALAIASSARETPVDSSLVAIGEVGLGGEIRGVGQMERRLSEAARRGFRKALIPASARERAGGRGGIELLGVATLAEAVRAALKKGT